MGIEPQPGSLIFRYFSLSYAQARAIACGPAQLGYVRKLLILVYFNNS